MVIVSLQETNQEAVRTAAIHNARFDIVELRVDTFKNGDPLAAVGDLKQPVILTLRTAAQGGELDITAAAYIARLREFLTAHKFAAVDLELQTVQTARRTDAQAVASLLSLVEELGIPIIWSHHEWQRTPSVDEIREFFHLLGQQTTPHGTPKLALMAHSPADTAVLLECLREYTAKGRPAIGISMGDFGALSRIAAGAFGGVATFASCGSASAPGQLNLDRLAAISDALAAQGVDSAAAAALSVAEISALLARLAD